MPGRRNASTPKSMATMPVNRNNHQFRAIRDNTNIGLSSLSFFFDSLAG
jgi:hypothetical protein